MCHYLEWCFKFDNIDSVYETLRQAPYFTSESMIGKKYLFEFSLIIDNFDMENTLSVSIENGRIFVDEMGNADLLKNLLGSLKQKFAQITYQFNQQEVIW